MADVANGRIVSNIREAEEERSRDVGAQQRRWRYRLRRGRVWFDEEVKRAHRRLKQSVPGFIRHGSLLNLLTAPMIYSLCLPLLLLDAWVTVYQWICFPIYGIARVKRRRFFVVDRHRLSYLNVIEKAHCFYCSYATGLLAYLREITARTQQYWCPIKHSRPIQWPHSHYRSFLEFGDAVGYRRRLPALRAKLGRPAKRPGRAQARNARA